MVVSVYEPASISILRPILTLTSLIQTHWGFGIGDGSLGKQD